LIRIDKSLLDKMGIDKSYIVIPVEQPIGEKPRLAERKASVQSIEAMETEADMDVLIDAQVEAEKLVENAMNEVESIRKKAWDQGYKDGLKEADEKATSQADVQSRAVRDMLKTLKDCRHEMLEKMQDRILELALVVAEKIVNLELKKDDTIYKGLVLEAIDKLGRSDKIKIFINNDDYNRYFKSGAEWLQAEDGQTAFEVVCDQELSPGDCMVESDRGIISSSIRMQLEKAKWMLTEDDKSGKDS